MGAPLEPMLPDTPAQSSADTWVPVCGVDDIPVLGARVVRGRTIDIALFRTGDDRVFALHDRCPHKGGPLSQGIVYGDRVACPLHNVQVELATGCAIAPDEGCTARLEVSIRSRCVHLHRDALLTDPRGAAEADDGPR